MHLVVTMSLKVSIFQEENTNDAIAISIKRESNVESCVTNTETSGDQQEDTAVIASDSAPSTEELKEFVDKFKKERLKMGITQNDVGHILAEKFDKFVSQTTISRFESLTLSYKNMCSLKPLFECLINSPLKTPALRKKASTCPKRRIRTVLHPDVKSVLETRFKRNAKPSVEEVTDIATELNLPLHVLRNWFQNRRQREKKEQTDLS